jgi:hypothetical protein
MKRLLLSTLAACALLSTPLAGPSYAAPTPAPTAQTAHRAPQKDTTAPAPVTGLTVSGNTLRSLSLEWAVPKDADLAHILIRRALGDQPPLSASDGTLVAVLSSHATGFTDRKLDSGASYSYAVYASDRQQNLSAPSALTALTLTSDKRTGIRGELTDEQGHPIAGVRALVRDVGNGEYAGQAVTGADGRYRVTNLQPGTYTVCYETTPQTKGPSSSGYFNACYRQQPFGYDGTPLTVTAGKTLNGINDYLRVAGAISGRVTDPSGTGLGNVRAYVVHPYSQHAWATSAADGSYTITGLPTDSYQVCFDPGYATGGTSTGYFGECYDDQPPWSGTGTPIPVSIGHTTTGINASFAVGGAVTGKVTDPAGNPVPGVSEWLEPSAGQDLGLTDAQGIYRIIGIAPGTYTLCVNGTESTSPTAPYGYATDCGPEFEVAAGQTGTQNRALQPAGAIGGSVTGPDGSPVADVLMAVFDATGTQVNTAETDESGNWRLPGLDAGQYTVCYNPTSTSGGYRRGCYDGQPDGATTGTPVTVTAGQLTTVNTALAPGATISGTVTDSHGAPLEGVVVTVISLTDETVTYSARTGDDAIDYTLTGLSAGSYAVCFDGTYAQGPEGGGYLSECYDNQASFDTADPVVLGGADTVRVDAALAGGPAITGP